MSERFDDVVRNAFDFLGRSIDELEKHPKYSVIHFYSAIELFVKARLLKEHWALIVMKPDQADKAKFLRGDFQLPPNKLEQLKAELMRRWAELS